MIKGIEVLECSFKQKFLHGWITFLDMKHLIDTAIKLFSLTLVEYVAFFEEACVPMGFQEMLSKHQVIILKNIPMKVSGYRAVVA